ncbi:oxidoreductase [Aureococcus anophagefferens]|nr:oxidoreductase [Aureococcus anophagefferens]
MPLFQRESATTSKRGIAASKSELLARLAEFSAVDDSAYLSEEGFVEARRAAVRQQRRLVRRSDEGSGFLCAPSTRKSSQRHRVWQPDDVRAPWIEYDKVCAKARALERPRSAVRGGAGVTERFAGLGGARGAAAGQRRGAAPPPPPPGVRAAGRWRRGRSAPHWGRRSAAQESTASGASPEVLRRRPGSAPPGARRPPAPEDPRTRRGASTALLTDYKASAAAPATKPRRFARVDPNVPATRRSLLTRQLSASTLPRPVAADVILDDVPDAVDDWDVDVDVAAALRPGKRVATLGEAECRTWSVEDDRATPMPAYAAVSCDLLAKLSPLLMRGEHGPLVAKLAAALRECVYVDPGTDEDARELFADETWFDRCLRVERELERLKEDMKLARAGVTLKNQLEKRLPGREKRATFPKAPISAGFHSRLRQEYAAMHKFLQHTCLTAWIGWHKLRKLRVRQMRARWGRNAIFLRWRRAAREGLLRERAAAAGPARVRESLLERFRQDKHASMHDRFFDEEEPEELDDDAPVIDKATSTPADWEVRTQKTMIAEAKDKDDHSKNVNLKRFGRTDKVAEMPVEKAVSLIPLIFEELSRVETSVHAVLSGSSRLELRALRDAVAVVFKHTAEELVNKLNRLPHTFKKDVRGGMVDADDALAELFARDRWALELAKQRRLWVDHFEHHATPEGCMEFFDFNAAVVEGTAAPPAEALVMRLYTEWGTALEIACFVVQKNYIARCWRKRKSKTQNEALEFLRGEKPRWTEASMARLSANLALRRWRRQMIRADPEALFADAHNDAEVAYILEARRGFEANSGAPPCSSTGRLAKRARRTTVAATRSYVAPLKELDFCINEVHDFEAHYAKHFGDREHVNAETLDMVLTEVAKFCENELAPLNEAGDAEGCTWVDERTVTTPKGYKAAYDQFVEGGWQGLSFPEKYGGQELPYSYSIFQADMMATANWTWTMYPGLSKGAINTIYSHCTEELKDKYLPPLVSGEWTGTMCLTEPACGSDLAQVATKAVPNGDGSYKITGTKIFISCGDHDMTDNVLHCVLARLPGAPEGTKGISLFLVPKHLVGDDGAVGDFNKTNIGRIEDKMGCHGSSTCEINFDESAGWLIGSENKGLNHMFTFINTSRLGTAMQGVAAAELAFQNGLPYAKDRLAMRALDRKNVDREPDKAADPIIAHPDVRRMLLTQKAVAEGGRSMVFECALIVDEMQLATEAGDTAKYEALDDRLGFLTPILKGYLTEMGVEAANLGIQIFGGHGYIKSNKQEQVVRDARIAPVWEGTTQIQALDLLGRKVLLQKLAPINHHCKGVAKFAFDALVAGGTSSDGGNIRSHAFQLLKHVAEWYWLTLSIGKKAMKDRDIVGSASVDYLMFAGHVTLAEHWLKMELAADAQLAQGGGGQDPDFCKAKIATARFAFEDPPRAQRRHDARAVRRHDEPPQGPLLLRLLGSARNEAPLDFEAVC